MQRWEQRWNSNAIQRWYRDGVVIVLKFHKARAVVLWYIDRGYHGVMVRILSYPQCQALPTL